MVKTRVIISLVSIIAVFTLGIIAFFISSGATEWLTGKTITTRAFILETQPENCTVNLTQGLNMVSFPCETSQHELSMALSDENNQTLNFTYIFTFDTLNDNLWKSYNPNLPNWTTQNKPRTLNRREGYFIYVEEPGTYFAEGIRYPTTNTQLREGWNLVGYPSKNEKPIEEVLESIAQNYISVHSRQKVGNSHTWLKHVNGEGGDLTTFKPGYAYWILMKQDAIWRLEW